jgi:hypothetical protein
MTGFAKMKGEEVFELIRTALALESARVEGVEAALGRADPERLLLAAKFGAAADVMTAIVAEGQDNRQRRKNPPAWVTSERDRARWDELRSETDRLLKVLADQARASLVGSTGPPEAAREESEDGAGNIGLGEGAGGGETGLVGAA